MTQLTCLPKEGRWGFAGSPKFGCEKLESEPNLTVEALKVVTLKEEIINYIIIYPIT